MYFDLITSNQGMYAFISMRNGALGMTYLFPQMESGGHTIETDGEKRNARQIPYVI